MRSRSVLAAGAAVAVIASLAPAALASSQSASVSAATVAAPAPRGDVDTVPDPAAPGPYATERVKVFRGWQAVDVGMPTKVEDLAEVTYPVRGDGAVARGTFPVVLLLHGRHAYCSVEGPAVRPPDPLCAGTSAPRPVPSYTGYRYVADALASQGRVVVSISANGINAQDDMGDMGMTARGRLVVHHLRALDRAALLDGHLDLSRTVLMGHSRGGEGVVAAAQMLSDTPLPGVRISAVVPLAPTTFSRPAPPAVPTVTLLPACDGDVLDLQGQTLVDRGRDLYGGAGALRSSVWFAGGNHNYLNTEWTPGLSVSGTGSDDARYIYSGVPRTSSCHESRRLSPSEARTIGASYLAAVVRWVQDGDSSMRPLLDGTGTVPAPVHAAGMDVRATSLAGPDRLLLTPQPGVRVQGRHVRIAACVGNALNGFADEPGTCALGAVAEGLDTAWLGQPFIYSYLPGRTAVRMSWTRPGWGAVQLGGVTDLSGSSRVSARVVVDPASRATFRMTLVDDRGRRAVVPLSGRGLSTLSRGAEAARLVPQQAWIDLSTVSGIDLRRITALGIDVTGRGSAWILDVSHRTGRPAPSAPLLPTADIPTDTIFRVPVGTSTVVLPVRLSRPAPAGAILLAQTQSSFETPPVIRRIEVPTGAVTVDVPIEVTIPEVIAPDDQFGSLISIYALSGLTVGQWAGITGFVPEGVRIREVTLGQADVVAPPGGAFDWDFGSSDGGRVQILAQVVAAGMDYADLDPDYRESYGLPSSGPIVPDAEWTLFTDEVEPGVFRLSIPLAKDADPGAWISLGITSVSGGVFPESLPLLDGTVSGPEVDN